MTQPISCSKKAAGYENNDTVDALMYSMEQIPQEESESVSERLKRIKLDLAIKYVYGLSKAYSKGTDGDSILMGPDVLWLLETVERYHNEPTVDISYLNERHCKDTETIHQLHIQLAREKERGNDFCDKMLAAERLHREENAKVINLQAEIKRLDSELLKYAHLEDYLFQTMQLAQEQREKYLRECDGE